MDILTDKKVKIRKDRQCFGCCRVCPAGTVMNYYVSLDQGEFQSTYLCPVCYMIALDLHADDEYSQGDLKAGDPDHWQQVHDRLEAERISITLPNVTCAGQDCPCRPICARHAAAGSGARHVSRIGFRRRDGLWECRRYLYDDRNINRKRG